MCGVRLIIEGFYSESGEVLFRKRCEHITSVNVNAETSINAVRFKFIRPRGGATVTTQRNVNLLCCVDATANLHLSLRGGY